MEVFKDLFNDWVGILSLGVIAVTILIALVFLLFSSANQRSRSKACLSR